MLIFCGFGVVATVEQKLHMDHQIQIGANKSYAEFGFEEKNGKLFCGVILEVMDEISATLLNEPVVCSTEQVQEATKLCATSTVPKMETPKYLLF